jgi:hypothetical protein
MIAPYGFAAGTTGAGIATTGFGWTFDTQASTGQVIALVAVHWMRHASAFVPQAAIWSLQG